MPCSLCHEPHGVCMGQSCSSSRWSEQKPQRMIHPCKPIYSASTLALLGLSFKLEQRIAHKCCEDAASRQSLASQEC